MKNFQMIEKFLLSANKTEFLQTLIKYSDEYEAFKMIANLNDNNIDPKTLLSDFKKKNDPYLLGKLLLSIYDKCNSEEDKQAALADIRKYLGDSIVSFKHSKPSAVQASNLQKTTDETPSSLVTSNYNKNRLLDEFYNQAKDKTTRDLDKFTSVGLQLLEVEKLLQKDISIIREFLARVLDYSTIPNFIHLFVQYYKKELEKNKHHVINESYLKKFTIAQLVEMMKEYPQFVCEEWFVSEWYQKTFPNNLNLLSPKEKRNEILKRYEWVRDLRPKFQGLESQLLYHLICIGIETNIYEKGLFLTYLQNPMRSANSFTSNYKEKIKNIQYENKWEAIHGLGSASYDEEEMISKYLEHFFKTNELMITDVEVYFELKFLQQIYYQVVLYKGESVENITDYFSECEIDSFKKQSQITILPTSKKQFYPEDTVKINLELKNISHLSIKIFEMHLSNYFTKNNCEVTENINLEGFVPSEEIELTYSEPPMKKFQTEIAFESLTNKKRGTFVLDLMGGGMSSRAIINKGLLACISTATKDGMIFRIYDEKNQLCCTETKLKFSNFTYIANEDGNILVPYMKNSGFNGQAILSYHDFSSLQYIHVPTRNLAMKTNFLYENEAFLVGNEASLLLQPKLVLNDEVNLNIKDYVRSAELIIESENTDGVKGRVLLNNLVFLQDDSILVKHSIVPKIKLITLNLQLTLYDDQVLTNRHSININTYQGSNMFVDFFMSQEKDGYALNVIGKNGEFYSNHTIVLEIYSIYFTEPENVTLKTDSKGKILLGKMQSIKKINATLLASSNIQESKKSFFLLESDSHSFPNNITITNQDSLILPRLNAKNKMEISLIKIDQTSENRILSEHRNKINLNENNSLEIGQLEEGNYILIYHKNGKSVNIKVIQITTKYEDGLMMFTKNAIIKQSHDFNSYMLGIESMEITESEYRIKVNSSSNTKATILLSTYQNQNVNTKNQTVVIDPKITKIDKPYRKSLYSSNLKLSDEYTYVINRKNLKRFIGNTLEKPQVLLKRKFLRDTSTANEELKVGEYKSSYADKKDSRSRPKPMQRRMMGYASSALSSGANTKIKDLVNQLEKPFQIEQPDNACLSVNSFLNFLKNPGKIITSIKISEDGYINIPKELIHESYNILTLILQNEKTSVHKLFNISQNKFEKKQMTHEKGNSNKILITKRITQGQENNSELILKDLMSSDFYIVDSIKSLYDVMCSVCNSLDIPLKGETGFEQFEFLNRWDSLSDLEKWQFYDKFICHEVNLFLKMKDPAFFEVAIRPFLMNKIEKTFMDLFLLDDKKRLQSYLEPGLLESLNHLEISLLIKIFSDTHKEDCKKIVDRLRDTFKVAFLKKEQYNSLFDRVLLTKSAEKQNELKNLRAGQQKRKPSNHSDASSEGSHSDASYRRGSFDNLSEGEEEFGEQEENTPKYDRKRNASFCQEIDDDEMDEDEASNSFLGECEEMVCERPKKMKRKLSICRFEKNEAKECKRAYDECSDQLSVALSCCEPMKAKASVKTNEFIEKQYFLQDINTDSIEFTSESLFWLDYCVHVFEKKQTPFLSDNFLWDYYTLTDMLGCLALIDLPFAAVPQVQTPVEPMGLKIQFKSNALSLVKQLIEQDFSAKKDLDIVLIQRYFDPKDQFFSTEEEPEVKIEKKVDEFLKGKLYGCKIVVTNSTVSQHLIQVVTEVPGGSIPINKLDYIKVNHLTLDSYSSKTLDYYFYFPSEGKFPCNPATVAKGESFITIGKDEEFDVVESKKKIDLGKIDDILSRGTQEDLLTFLTTKNINNQEVFSFKSIYWLLSDKDFFKKVIEIFRQRKMFDTVVWSYGFLHNDEQVLAELFRSSRFIKKVAKKKNWHYVSNKFINYDKFQVFDFYPIITSRAHLMLNYNNKVLNEQLKERYIDFLNYLLQKYNVTLRDKLIWTYYLILQERQEEAYNMYLTIEEPKEEGFEHQLQYDYLTAYLDFIHGYPTFEKARKIVEKYLAYPVISWRNLFIEMINQLAEYDGEEPVMLTEKLEKDISTLKKQEIEKVESLTVELVDKKLCIVYQNIEEIDILFYKVDFEVIFSKNPFFFQNMEDYSHVIPNLKINHKLVKSEKQTTEFLDIPLIFQNSNIYIQIKSNNKSAFLNYMTTALKVQINENYGQVKIMDEQLKPLSKVYVKAYYMLNSGETGFYKDGYTDIGGRFDYASSNTKDIKDVKNFALFMCSDDFGIVIREAKPPTTLGKAEGSVLELKSKTHQLRQTAQETSYAKKECESKKCSKKKQYKPLKQPKFNV